MHLWLLYHATLMGHCELPRLHLFNFPPLSSLPQSPSHFHELPHLPSFYEVLLKIISSNLLILSQMNPSTGKCMHAQLLQSCPVCATPWTVGHQAPLSMEFSRQEDWSALPSPPPGHLPDPGIKPASLSAALASGFFTTSTTYTPALNPILRVLAYHEMIFTSL